MADELHELAQGLGITDAQLARLYYKFRQEHGEEAQVKLLSWLRTAQAEFRDRKWLLSRRSVPAYTESPSEALTDAGEAPPPDEIETYRKSREARDAYQAEQMDEVGNLMAAMRLVRAALDDLPPDQKASMSRSIWAYKGRMDALEREIRRRIAA